ncbi:hypothetical protein ACH3XW_50420 [Acanthocheilonema viteae]
MVRTYSLHQPTPGTTFPACLEASGLRNPLCFETVQPLPLPHRAEISIQIRVSWKFCVIKGEIQKKHFISKRKMSN